MGNGKNLSCVAHYFKDYSRNSYLTLSTYPNVSSYRCIWAIQWLLDAQIGQSIFSEDRSAKDINICDVFSTSFSRILPSVDLTWHTYWQPWSRTVPKGPSPAWDTSCWSIWVAFLDTRADRLGWCSPILCFPTRIRPTWSGTRCQYSWRAGCSPWCQCEWCSTLQRWMIRWCRTLREGIE